MAGSYGRRWVAVPVVVAAAVTAAGCGGDGGDTHKAAARHTTATTAAGEPHTLVFKITGAGRITTLTYTVNGTPTTLRNLTIPWTKTIEVPAAAGGVTWSLDTDETLTGGSRIYDTAYVDGVTASQDSCYGTPGTSCSGSLSGSVSD